MLVKAGKRPPGKQSVPARKVSAPKATPMIAKAIAPSEAKIDLHPRLFLTKISTGRSSREYQADEAIFSQGDTADAVFYIESGKVKLTVVSTSGKEAVVAILPDGNFFGEGCLAGQPLRMATARMVQRGAITRMAKTAMIALLHAEPVFAERFLAHVLSRNIRMEADLVDHLFNSSEKRLARLLLLMANFGQESKPIPLVAKMSQETLAEMIGTTRSRVSFFMNRFRELGFIEYDGGGLHVHSSLVSVVLHD
jgi:CRP-like cAMP-binding protein